MIQTTGDPNWPKETNEPSYARLIVKNIEGILSAHSKLRIAHYDRFTDSDFKNIVAFGSLGIGELVFKKLTPPDYWRIGLLSHELLDELDDLLPEATKPIREALQSAPLPFSRFMEKDSEPAIRAFYLSVILKQHFPNWQLLLANMDPISFSVFPKI